jgi:histidine triad (HIT) family protein
MSARGGDAAVNDLWTPVADAPGCPFCDVAHGRSADAAIVWESPSLVAFLDRRPLFPGHVLVAPRAHVPTLHDLPEAEAGPLLRAVTLLSEAVVEALAADGSFIAVNDRESQSVPHLHVHIMGGRKMAPGMVDFVDD